MGALILLLLVTTRRIRQQTLAEQARERIQEQAKPAPPESADPIPLTIPAPPDLTSDSDHLQSSDEPILPLLASDPSPPVPQGPDPTEALLARLAALETEHQELTSTIASKQAELTKMESVVTTESTALANLHAESESLTAEQERMNQLYLRLIDQRENAEKRADSLQHEITRVRAQLAEADSKFAIVPYDGFSGTTRRPIIIECTEDSLTFVSEGVTLTANDLDGFTPRFNPLLYATQALIRFWERRDRMSSGEEIGAPYLLLVVRPGGTTSYYVARELLAGLRQPFGYELVTDEQQFAWPRSDLEASAICRMLVDKMLTERDELYEVALRQGAELPNHSDEHGRFRMEEIDRLRNPTREVMINGQRFSREPGLRNSQTVLGRNASEAGTVESRQALSNPSFSGGPSRREHVGRESGRLAAGRGEQSALGSGVHTSQQTAVTRADRMTEWLRDGTVNVNTPTDKDTSPNEDQQRNVSRSNERSTPPQNRRDYLSNNPSQGLAAQDEQPVQAARNPTSPAPSDFLRRPQTHRQIDPNRPQWGSPSSGGTIGFEHEVRIHVSSTQLAVGSASTLDLTQGLTPDELKQQLATAIDQDVRSWGDPPRSFYWIPHVRFIVERGAGKQHQHLKSIIKDWGLRCSVEYVAE